MGSTARSYIAIVVISKLRVLPELSSVNNTRNKLSINTEQNRKLIRSQWTRLTQTRIESITLIQSNSNRKLQISQTLLLSQGTEHQIIPERLASSEGLSRSDRSFTKECRLVLNHSYKSEHSCHRDRSQRREDRWTEQNIMQF